MKETWLCYDSIKIPDGRYELTDFRYDGKSISLIVDDETYQITILFEVAVAFRVCDEGDRIRTVNEVATSNGKFFLANNLICLVQNSDFAKWISNEKYAISSELRHYAVVTGNDIVDILAINAPCVTIELLTLHWHCVHDPSS